MSTIPHGLHEACELLERAVTTLPAACAQTTELALAIASGNSDRIFDASHEVLRALGESEPTCRFCGVDIDQHGYCSSACYYDDNFDRESY